MVYQTFEIKDNVRYVVEVGTHCGSEAISLSQKYPQATVMTYEADPQKWERIQRTLKLQSSSVIFRTMGLGQRVEERMFYKFTGYENDGADSFLKRHNGEMKPKQNVHISTLELEMAKFNIDKIDLLCLDTQGFEYYILKGLGDRIKDIKNIIMELPDIKEKLNTNEFKIPLGEDSVYEGAKNSKTIIEFLNNNGFEEVCRKRENDLESNVHFRKKI